MKWQRTTAKASRVMCILAHGPAPSPLHVAAHSCGKGTDGCVNPKHLRWATEKENYEDAVAHGVAARGERHGSAILTEKAVAEIREKGVKNKSELAQKFGVSVWTIYNVCSGKRWKDSYGQH
jgi:hypothetical protein